MKMTVDISSKLEYLECSMEERCDICGAKDIPLNHVFIETIGEAGRNVTIQEQADRVRIDITATEQHARVVADNLAQSVMLTRQLSELWEVDQERLKRLRASLKVLEADTRVERS